MYTSLRPDAFDTYAIHLPSGENAGMCSRNGVARNGAARDSPSRIVKMDRRPVCSPEANTEHSVPRNVARHKVLGRLV